MIDKNHFCAPPNEFLLVVDNFFDNPQKIRQIALSKIGEFGKKYSLINDREINYPGIRIYVGEEISNNIEKKLSSLLGGIKLPKMRSAMFSLTMAIHGHGIFHTDGHPLDFAGVIYLNEESPEDSGTSFYDFTSDTKLMRECEIDRSVGGYMQKIRQSNASQNLQYIQSMGEKRKELTDKYSKKTLQVESKFNRMIFYNSNMYHAPGKSFGNTIHDSRLVIVLAFSFQDRQKSVLSPIFKRFGIKNA